MKNKMPVALCKEILEIAMDDVRAFIPDGIIESTIFYLSEYEKLKAEKSWTDFPEAMGR